MLHYLKMINFRNYIAAELSLERGNNFFIGENGQGKSNLLEAVYYCSTASSFRFAREEDMLSWDKPFFYLRAIVFNKNNKYLIELGYEAASKRKVIKINGKKERSDYLLSIFPVIYFIPEDLLLIKGSPSQRRNFLDIEICRINLIYREDLRNYKRVLAQRNKLLKTAKIVKGFNEQLSLWNEQLVHFGSRLILERIKTVEKLNLLSRLAYRRIAPDSGEELNLYYSSSLAPALTSSNINLSSLKDLFKEKLKSLEEEEIERGTTLIGPHRDDLTILLSQRNARRFSSQGQQRSAVLALKIAEIELFRSEKNKEPLLLLDDVFSELDRKRCELFLDSCHLLGQTLITVTDPALLPSIKEGKNSIFTIKKGHISRQNGKNFIYSP